MVELLEVLGGIAAEAETMGKVTVIGALLLLSKYLTDILRAKMVQRALAGIEKAAKLPIGSLQWAWWSDRTRVLVAMLQAFAVGLLGAVATGMQWGAAVGAGLVAAVGSKGLHDSGVMPGRRPSKRGPAVAVDRSSRASRVSRSLSLKTDAQTGRTRPREVKRPGEAHPVAPDWSDETTSPSVDTAAEPR